MFQMLDAEKQNLDAFLMDIPTKHGMPIIEFLRKLKKVDNDPIKRLSDEMSVEERVLREFIVNLKKTEEEANKKKVVKNGKKQVEEGDKEPAKKKKTK